MNSFCTAFIITIFALTIVLFLALFALGFYAGLKSAIHRLRDWAVITKDTEAMRAIHRWVRYVRRNNK